MKKLKTYLYELANSLEFSTKLIFARSNQVQKVAYFPKISIIIVVHNGLKYVKNCLTSLKKTTYPNYEIVVVDNQSDTKTQAYLLTQQKQHLITTLVQSNENRYFSGGNNLGVKNSARDSHFVLLLNSDTVILEPSWLDRLVELSTPNGIVAFGYASLPFRPDGWCFLMAKKAYHHLDGISEYFKMNWGISDLTKRALLAKMPVGTVVNYSKYIQHLGGKSYSESSLLVQDEHKPNIVKLVISAPWWKIGLIKIS